ncbi:hypothetical protein [Paenibacillus donghaensis]|uniref:hypothetical protein n=1 Tax=Paenibacillus donghaensis TaxID=414771 RepID=UPI001D161EED|nr:hypothetical protein [Paenibacillus donghaensis]
MDNRDEQEKKQMEEYKKKPLINMADSMNRSVIGDMGGLTKGGCLVRVLTMVIIVGLLIFLLLK